MGDQLLCPTLRLVCQISRVYKAEGQVEGVVEEPVEVSAPGAAEFQGPQISVHAPRYEWHLEVDVQGLDEEARQRIMAIEGLLHRFGVRTEASRAGTTLDGWLDS